LFWVVGGFLAGVGEAVYERERVRFSGFWQVFGGFSQTGLDNFGDGV
jgi:hypothetical protein